MSYYRYLKTGNCFYPTLSVIICEEQRDHLTIREQLVAFMMTDRISQQLKAQYPSVNTVSASGNWAEVEILAATAFIKTDILVYTELGWVLYTVLAH